MIKQQQILHQRSNHLGFNGIQKFLLMLCFIDISNFEAKGSNFVKMIKQCQMVYQFCELCTF